MPIVNRIGEFADDMKAWRQWIHAHPELKLDCHETAAFVVEKLREFGVDEIHEGIARSGVVAITDDKRCARTSRECPALSAVSTSLRMRFVSSASDTRRPDGRDGDRGSNAADWASDDCSQRTAHSWKRCEMA